MKSPLLLLFCLFTAVYSLSVEDATYEFKQGTFLGTNFNLVEYSMKFDEEFFVLDPIICPTVRNTSVTFDPTCRPCSYVTRNCGEEPEPDRPECPPCSAELVAEACNNTITAPWTELSDGDAYSAAGDAYDEHFYRYHVEGGRGFRIEILPRFGRMSIFVDTEEPYPTRFHAKWFAAEDQSGPRYIPICPSDIRYSPGTYFIRVSLRTPSNYTIKVDEIEVFEEYEPVVNNCSNILPTHQCVDDNEVYTGGVVDYVEENSLFTYVATDQRPIFLYVDSSEGRRFVYASLINEVPLFSRFADYYGIKDGPNLIYFIPNASPENPQLVYINVRGTGNYVFTLKREANFNLIGVNDVPPFSWYYLTFAVARFRCTSEASGDVLLTCNDDIVDCVTVWPMYPGEDVNPVFPPPAVAINAAAEDFSLLENQEFLATPQNNTFVFMMSRTSSTSTSLFNEEDFGECVIEYRDKLVDRRLNPVRTPHRFRQIEEPCDVEQFSKFNQQLQDMLEELQEITDPAEALRARFLVDFHAYQREWASCREALEDIFLVNVTEDYIVPDVRYCNRSFVSSNFDDFHKLTNVRVLMSTVPLNVTQNGRKIHVATQNCNFSINAGRSSSSS